jgi:hypothetical protein
MDFENQEYETDDVDSFFDSVEHEANSSTVSAFSKKPRNGAPPENGCFLIKRKVKGSNVKIPCWATRNATGSTIRSATTGIYNEELRVGKRDEDLFFKVRITTGELGSAPFANDFYFDSPEQYEKHFFTILPNGIKAKWVEKNLSAKLYKSQQIQEQSQSRKKYTVIH